MRFITGFILALISSAALAQTPVKQSGNITPNQVPWWITSGVIGGGVTSFDSPITSFGVTNNGGLGLCDNSDRITAAGRNTICLSVATAGAPAKLIVQNYGTAAPLGFEFVINGTTIIPAGGITALTVGTTTIGGGTNQAPLFDNAGVLGNGLINSTWSTFLQIGTGAVTRTVQSKLQDTVNVADFGALTGASDNATAFQNANNAVATSGGSVGIPAGNFKVCSTVHISANVAFVGVPGAVISPCSNNQIVFDKINGSIPTIPDNVRFSNFTIDAGTNTGVTGFKAVFANEATLRNMTFAALAINVEGDRSTFLNIFDSVSRGNLSQGGGELKIWSSDDAAYASNVTVQNYSIQNIGNGVQSAQAIYVRRAVLSSFSNIKSNDLSAKIGIVIENDSQGITVTDYSSANQSSGVVLQRGSGVAVDPSFTILTNVSTDQPHGTSINILNGNWTTVIGGTLTSSGVGTTNKCVYVGVAGDTSISDVQCQGMNGIGGAFVELSNNVDRVRIDNNKITNSTTGVLFDGTPTNIRVHGNTFSTVTNPTSGTITGSGNYIFDNGGIPDTFNGYTFTPGTGTVNFGTGGTVLYTTKQVFSNLVAGGATSSTTCYVGTQGCSTVASTAGFTVPFSGTLKNMTVNGTAAAGAGQSLTITLYVGAYGSIASTTITCVISGASATTCSDNTHSVAIAAGQAWAFQLVSTGSITAGIGTSYGIEFDNP